MAQVECGDLSSGAVRKNTGMAKPFADVEQRELRARVRTLAPTKEPSALPPRGEVDKPGELVPAPQGASSRCELDPRHPVLLLGEHERRSHRASHRKADRKVTVRLDKTPDEVVCCTGGVGAHGIGGEGVTGLMSDLVVDGERGGRLVQEPEVVIGVVRPGIARAEHGGERLCGRVTPHAEGWKPKSFL